FFFQAEDGIRDRNVTGVQTCALPISMDQRDDDIEFDFFDDEPATGETQSGLRVRNPLTTRRGSGGSVGPPRGMAPLWRLGALVRSEERRVGKECRCRWAA